MIFSNHYFNIADIYFSEFKFKYNYKKKFKQHSSQTKHFLKLCFIQDFTCKSNLSMRIAVAFFIKLTMKMWMVFPTTFKSISRTHYMSVCKICSYTQTWSTKILIKWWERLISLNPKCRLTTFRLSLSRLERWHSLILRT